MDQSRVQKVIDEHLKSLTEQLGVERWKITIGVGRCENPEHSAEVSRDTPYNLASIMIDSERHHSEETALEDLKHELVHLVLAPMDAYRDVMRKSLIPEIRDSGIESIQWHYAIEQCVINVMRAISGKTPSGD